MKLTSEQIEQLFEFIRKKNVDYYDVQVELVDHLASSIEEKLSQNSHLSFESALREVYQGFGVFGFSELVEEKEQKAKREIKKMYRTALLSFLSFPKIAFTISSFLLFQLLYMQFEFYDFRMFLFIVWLVVTALLLANWFRIERKFSCKFSDWNTPALSFSGILVGFLNLFLNTIVYNDFRFSYPYLLSFFFVAAWAFYEILTNVHKKLESEYPEAFV